MPPGSSRLSKPVTVAKSRKNHTSLSRGRNNEPSVYWSWYVIPFSLTKCSIVKFLRKVPVTAKIPTAVFQCTFLPSEFLFLATALTAFAMSGRVWLASRIKHSTSSLKRPVCLRPSSSRFVLTELMHISPFTANPANIFQIPAMCRNISNLTRQLFYAGIARIQPRVSFCSRIPIDKSANPSLHVVRLLYRGSSHSACPFPIWTHVVWQCC